MARVLLIDDDQENSEELRRQLLQASHEVRWLDSAEEGLNLLGTDPFDLVLVDNVMPRMTGLEFLAALKKLGIRVPVIMMTNAPNDRTAIQASNLGAFDYVIKPLDFEKIMAVLTPVMLRALEITRRPKPIPLPELKPHDSDDDSVIVGRSAAILEVFRLIGRAIRMDEPVLILGETGTGKELVAGAIHTNSARKNMNFVAVNCPALSNKELWEDELFGHEKDAFTGATKMRKGCFEHAHGGTLFLDEIGDMPLDLQVKLLRALESGEIKRMGSNDKISVNVRVVAATNKNLEAMVGEGTFREDLYYRLLGIKIFLPPLRERKEDIPLLAHRFLSRMFDDTSSAPRLHVDALAALCNHPWKGNIRELRKVLIFAAGTCQGSQIMPEDLCLNPRDAAMLAPAPEPDCDESARACLRQAIAWAWKGNHEKRKWDLLEEMLECELLRYALSQPHKSEEELGKLIGWSKNFVRDRKKKYGLNKPDDVTS